MFLRHIYLFLCRSLEEESLMERIPDSRQLSRVFLVAHHTIFNLQNKVLMSKI